MEDPVRSTSLSSSVAAAPAELSARPGAPSVSGWVVSPGFDLCFLVNAAWPLLLLPGLANRQETVVDFWQIYFLTLPHRWITLVLVALDPDRREGRGWLLASLALVFLLLVLGVWAGTAAFTCLALVDYCWNAWHFAAQHFGVLRMYTRKVGGGSAWLERYGLRFFITYAILRTAAWATGWLGASSESAGWVRLVDLCVLAIPAVLIATALWGFRPIRTGRLAYLLSVCALYSGLLWSVALPWAHGVVVFTTASGLFHAVEYLAVVSHYADRRRTVGSASPWQRLARHWGWVLVAYVACLGSLGVLLDRRGGPLFVLWQGMNLWAALVHYAWDGMIWKLRRPATARVLGLASGSPAA